MSPRTGIASETPICSERKRRECSGGPKESTSFNSKRIIEIGEYACIHAQLTPVAGNLSNHNVRCRPFQRNLRRIKSSVGRKPTEAASQVIPKRVS